MMTKKWFGPALIGLGFIASLLLYSRLPDQVPSHWNWSGEVDDTTARFPGAFLGPLIAAAMWVLLPVLRRVDPRRRNYDRFDPTFWLLLNVLTVGFLLLHGLSLAIALGVQFDMPRALLVGIGLMFAAFGNYLPRLRSNWWMGIRTPWTLENEEVWRRTHRLGGRTFALGGLLCAAGALLLPRQYAQVIALVALVFASLTPVVYSYVIWRALPRS